MELIAAASAQFEQVVRRLPSDGWDRPTPSQISVRELVEHVVVGNRLTVLLLTGVDRSTARTQVAGDQLGDDPLGAVIASSAAQAAAFAVAPLDQPVDGPVGVVPVAAYLRFRLVDLVVHAWDLRRAVGGDESLDPAITAGVLALVEPHLGEMLATGAYGDGPSGGLAPQATAQDRLLDWFGRRPQIKTI